MTEFWFIEKITPPPEPVLFDSYHYHMFHGTGRRHGARYPMEDYTLGDALKYPLSLTKNVYDLAAVLQPALNLLVSEFMAQQLLKLANTALLEVKYEKLFWTPYEKGDFRYKRFRNEDELFGREQHDPSLAEQIGRYFEVIIPRVVDVMGHFQALRPLRLERPGKQTVLVDVCESLLKHYPMLWRTGILLAEPAAEILLPHLDPDFFLCTSWRV